MVSAAGNKKGRKLPRNSESVGREIQSPMVQKFRVSWSRNSESLDPEIQSLLVEKFRVTGSRNSESCGREVSSLALHGWDPATPEEP